MKHATIPVLGACALLLAAASCGGGSNQFVAPATTSMDVLVSPLDMWIDAPVNFTVKASNDQVSVTSVAIDYTGDGTWDATQDFHQASVSASFVHAYDSSGDVTVVAEVHTSDGKTTSKKLVLTVASKPPTRPVTYTMYGTSVEGGGCYAYGVPAECDDCAELLGTTVSAGVTKSLGSAPIGTRVEFNQGFNQWPVDPERHVYTCQFVLQLFSGAPGNEAAIGSGTCSTESTTTPGVLKCWIDVAGTVK